MKSARVLPEPCPSETETSSIISVSEAHPPSLQVSLMESQKEERKQAEEEKMEDVEGDDDEDHNKDQLEDTEAKAEDLVLDLSLSNEDSNHGSNTELNLIDSFDTNSSRNNSSSDISPPQGNENEPRVFSCNYCQRKFYSSQALGGHQNAHKRERTLAKRGHKTAAFGFPTSLPHRSYSSIASLPLHGSFNRSPLGIQVHSLIHKPSNYHNYHPNPIASSHFYGRNGWLTIPIDQQPAIGRLALENFHVPAATVGSSSGGAARFETVKKFSQQVSEGTGGFCWNSSVGHPKTKQDDHLKKLDLSLKL